MKLEHSIDYLNKKKTNSEISEGIQNVNHLDSQRNTLRFKRSGEKPDIPTKPSHLKAIIAYKNFLQKHKDFLDKRRKEVNNLSEVYKVYEKIEEKLSMFGKKTVPAKEIITQYVDTLIDLFDHKLLLSVENISSLEYDKYKESLFELSNLIDEEGNTSLLLAAGKGNKNAIDFLIRWDSNVNHTNQDRKKAIDLAWEKISGDEKYEQYCESILALLREDSQFPSNFSMEKLNKGNNAKTELEIFVEKRQELHTFIGDGSLDKVEKFFQNLKDIKFSKFYFNSDSQSALLSAINEKKYRIYAFLKSKGANLFSNEEERIVKLPKSEKDALDKESAQYLYKPNSAHISSLWSKSRSLQNDVKHFKRIKSWYEKLNLIEEISVILQIIECAKLEEIIFDFGKDSIVEVEYGGRHDAGIVDHKKGRIYIAADVDEPELLGTLAHELTHLAMQTVYENDCKPYYQKDEEEFNEITKKIKEATQKDNNEIDKIISRVFTAYKGREGQWNAELIVRVPHMLAKHAKYNDESLVCDPSNGREILNKQVKDLLTYYDEKVNEHFKSILPTLKNQNKIRVLNKYLGAVSEIELSGIKYKNLVELNNFFNQDKMILLVSQQSVWLSSINVYRALEKLPLNSLYHKNYILCKESTFADWEAELLNSKADLFLIESESDDFNELNSKVLEKLNNKKIILIAQQDPQWIESFEKSYKDKYVEQTPDISFDNLHEESKTALLKKQVTFQGEEKVSLGDLIQRENANDIIDILSLDQITRGKKIRIGSNLQDISDLSGAYHVVSTEIKKKHLKANIHQRSSTEDDINMGGLFDSDSEDTNAKKANNELFVVSGINGESLKNEFGIEAGKIILYNEKTFRKDISKGQYKFIILDSKDNNKIVEDFENVCRQYQKSLSKQRSEEQEENLIHLIEFKNDKFIWNRYYDPGFYIERQFHKIVIDNEKFKKYKEGKDIFLVSGIEENKFVEKYPTLRDKIASTQNELGREKSVFI